MTSQDAISAAVERLAVAQETRVPCAPVRDLIGTDDLAAAYAVQQGLVQRRLAARRDGRRPQDRRHLGGGAAASSGVDQPDFGYLLDDMDVSDGVDGTRSRCARCCSRGSRPRSRSCSPATSTWTRTRSPSRRVRDAVEVALPALEIVDSRIADWDIGFTDTVADNASSGLYVVGREGRTLDELEPRDVEMSLTINGEERSAGNGAACLGDPLEALRWLAVQAQPLRRPAAGRPPDPVRGPGPVRAVRPGRPGGGVHQRLRRRCIVEFEE